MRSILYFLQFVAHCNVYGRRKHALHGSRHVSFDNALCPSITQCPCPCFFLWKRHRKYVHTSVRKCRCQQLLILPIHLSGSAAGTCSCSGKSSRWRRDLWILPYASFLLRIRCLTFLQSLTGKLGAAIKWILANQSKVAVVPRLSLYLSRRASVPVSRHKLPLLQRWSGFGRIGLLVGGSDYWLAHACDNTAA